MGVVTWLGFATAPADQRHGLRQAVAALYARHGGRLDSSYLDAARAAAVSGTTVATASGGVSEQRWSEAAKEDGLSRRRVSAQPASRASAQV